jgi:hypothetical protein
VNYTEAIKARRKFTEEQVLDMRGLAILGIRMSHIAEAYETTPDTIRKIITGERYKNVLNIVDPAYIRGTAEYLTRLYQEKKRA